MMERNNDQISSAQLAAILSIDIIGVGILSLPRSAAEAVGPDSWILMIIASFLALILALVMRGIVIKFPKQSMIQYTKTLMGKPLGIIISLGFYIYLIMIAAIEVRAFGEITKEYLLITTPIEVLIISLLLSAVYLVRSGIEPIARMAQILFPIAILTAFVVVIPILPELDLSYFLPVLKTPFLKILKSIPIVFFSFIGIEQMLILSEFVIDPKNIKKNIFLIIGLVSTIYIGIVVITIGRFGLIETIHPIWPTLQIFKTVELPGAFIENIQIYVISIWILSVFMTLATVYYSATLIGSRLLGSKEHNYFVLPLLPIIYYLAIFPDNIAQVLDYMDKISTYIGGFYIVILPLTLFGVSIFKKEKGGKKNG